MSRCTRIYIKSGGTPLTAALRMCKPHPIDDRMYVIAWPGDLNEQGHYNFTSTAALHKQRAGALLEFTSTADSSPKQQQVQDDQSPSTAASPPRICATISIPCLSYLHMPSQLRQQHRHFHPWTYETHPLWSARENQFIYPLSLTTPPIVFILNRFRFSIANRFSSQQETSLQETSLHRLSRLPTQARERLSSY